LFLIITDCITSLISAFNKGYLDPDIIEEQAKPNEAYGWICIIKRLR
jgi:hypothetical protein